MATDGQITLFIREEQTSLKNQLVTKDSNMNDDQRRELQELQKLEGEGSLDPAQTVLLATLRALEQAEKTAEAKSKDFESALAQKDHFREKAEKAEAERKALEDKLNQAAGNNGGNGNASLDVEDYIDISTSLDGLDSVQKEKLAREHKLTGKPLSEIRQSEDFIFWNQGYTAKVEKERSALPPSGTQATEPGPQTLAEKLATASLEEKEKLLLENGLYKPPRPRSANRQDFMPGR